MAQKTRPSASPPGLDARAGPAAAHPDGAHPALRGEGGRDVRPRQDRRLPAPLHRRRRRWRSAPPRRCRPDDYAVASYREHGHCLAKGSDPRRMMAELFGRMDGLSKGKGGSMHLFDKSVNFLGGHGIVGAPPAARRRGRLRRSSTRAATRSSLCYFGDGAVPEGEFHESMNLAALWKLPVDLHLREQPLRHGHRASTARWPQTEIWTLRARPTACPREAVRRHGRARRARGGGARGRAGPARQDARR